MVLRHSKIAQDGGTVSSSCILQQQACRPGQKPFTEFPPAVAKLATNFPHRMNNITAKRDAGIFFLCSSLFARIKRAQLLVIKLKTAFGSFYSLGLTPVVLHEWLLHLIFGHIFELGVWRRVISLSDVSNVLFRYSCTVDSG